MALWGNSDLLTLPGAPASVTVVGTASSDFWTVEGADLEATVPTGTTILLGTEPGEEGFVTIEAHLSATVARVGKMSAVDAVVGTPTPAAYCDQPISLKNDPAYAPASPDGELDRSTVAAGIATAGIEALNAAGGGGIHAGWVGVTTYMDMHNNLRIKSETFVAASGIQTGNRPYPA